MTKLEIAKEIVKFKGNCISSKFSFNCEHCPILNVCETYRVFRRVFQIPKRNWDATCLEAAKAYLEENNS